MEIRGKSRDTMAIESQGPSKRRDWQLMTVHDIVVETPRVRTIRLEAAGWDGHLPGQHVDIRLTAEDGYQTERSYSISSPPSDELLALTVERVEGGEVSPYLVDTLRAGDRLELRGPIGGYFVWAGTENKPLLLVAGGSGITPLIAMLRHRDRLTNRAPATLIYSSRRLQDIIYRDEIDATASRDPSLRVVHALTRQAPLHWTGHRGRVDKNLLTTNCFAVAQQPAIFICGPTRFVDSIASLLVELGFDPLSIRTERFGP
jgi:ferredoxin-NADP reductase